MNIKAQNRILKLFDQDPHEAMELAVEQYTGLVWKTAAQHLENPEDVKECVNDTFMEFYLHRENFDPQKGSLATFLATIARNRAIGLYRKNKVRETRELREAADETDEAGELDRKIDLERAMETLKPEDREIIRMKYFVGMTIQEIAESLNLPYETVKKRHQRSLGKLRLALIAALVLVLALLLAACAYIFIRRLGIIPGYGITEIQDTPVLVSDEDIVVEDGNDKYVITQTLDIPVFLLDGEVVVEDTYGKYVIQNAVLANGDFVADGKAYFPSEDKTTWHLESGVVSMLDYGDDTLVCLTTTDYGLGDRNWAAFHISAEGLTMPDAVENVCSMTLHYAGAGIDFPLTFRRAAEGSGNYDLWAGEHGAILVIPEFGEGHLLLDLYPTVNDGTPGFGWEDNPPYLEDASGRRLDAEWTNGRGKYIRLDFGEAPPGEYKLYVPEVGVIRPCEADWSIAINLETCQGDEREYEIPEGTLSLAYCKSLDLQPGDTIGRETVSEGYSYWEIGLRYTIKEAQEEGYSYEPPWYNLQDDYDVPEGEVVSGLALSRILIGTEDGLYRAVLCIPDGFCDITTYRLSPANRMWIIWNCDAVIPFTVEEEDSE